MTSKKIEVFDASSSNEVDWIRIRAEGLKQHYVHKCLLPQLIVDLETRGFHVEEQVPISKASHDYGGAIISGCPRELIKIDLLAISIFSRDVSPAHARMHRRKVRTFAGGEKYFKMHGWLSCFVFTVDQHDMLRKGLGYIKEQAEEREGKFMKEWQARIDKKKNVKI